MSGVLQPALLQRQSPGQDWSLADRQAPIFCALFRRCDRSRARSKTGYASEHRYLGMADGSGTGLPNRSTIHRHSDGRTNWSTGICGRRLDHNCILAVDYASVGNRNWCNGLYFKSDWSTKSKTRWDSLYPVSFAVSDHWFCNRCDCGGSKSIFAGVVGS